MNDYKKDSEKFYKSLGLHLNDTIEMAIHDFIINNVELQNMYEKSVILSSKVEDIKKELPTEKAELFEEYDTLDLNIRAMLRDCIYMRGYFDALRIKNYYNIE